MNENEPQENSGDNEGKRKRTSSCENNRQRRPSRAATQGKKQYSDHNDDSKVSSDDDDNDDADTARPKKKQRIHKQVYLDAVNRYLKYPKPRPRQIDFLRSDESGQILSGEDKCKMSFSRYLKLIVAAIEIQTLARGYINRKAFLSLKKEEEKKRNKK